MDIPKEIRAFYQTARVPPAVAAWIELLIGDSFLFCEELNRGLGKAVVFTEPRSVWRYIAERAYLKGREDECHAHDWDVAGIETTDDNPTIAEIAETPSMKAYEGVARTVNVKK